MAKLRTAILALGGAAIFAAAAAAAQLRPGDALPSQASTGTPATVISSSASDALNPPDAWSCAYLLPEYQAWLAAGNSTSDWKYFGKTFRDEGTGELYDWTDWLRWARESECSVGPYVESEFAQLLALPVLNGVIGSAIAAAGAGGLLVSSGNADSPG